MSHTKGPWKWEDGYILDSQRKAFPVASVNAMPSIAESEANARLIAAAPEMLELLQGIARWDMLDSCGDGPYWKKAIALVINKATGAQEANQ